MCVFEFTVKIKKMKNYKLNGVEQQRQNNLEKKKQTFLYFFYTFDI